MSQDKHGAVRSVDSYKCNGWPTIFLYDLLQLQSQPGVGLWEFLHHLCCHDGGLLSMGEASDRLIFLAHLQQTSTQGCVSSRAVLLDKFRLTRLKPELPM